MNDFTNQYNQKCSIHGFTLAEVLITLGIIGVVAAMTIPILVKNYQEKAIISQLKRVSSTLSATYENVKVDEGEPNTWSVTCGNDLAQLFATYMKTEKIYAPANSGNGSYTQMGYSALPLSLDKQLSPGFYPQIKLSTGELFSLLPHGIFHRVYLARPLMDFVFGLYLI